VPGLRADLGKRRFDFESKEKPMDRRNFTKVMGAVVAGMAAGAKVFAADSGAPTTAPADKHICKGHNECKGKGGCKTDKNACAGKNECKGKGGCASAGAKHECGGKNECKGLGGCKTDKNACAGHNECKGKGGCAVPSKHEDAAKASGSGKDKKDKSACGGKNGCGK
jgi:hypothetical protein